MNNKINAGVPLNNEKKIHCIDLEAIHLFYSFLKYTKLASIYILFQIIFTLIPFDFTTSLMIHHAKINDNLLLY